MALLQSTALRAGQSASQRTTATLLTYQLLDMVRANRSEAALYGQIIAADFTAAGDGRSGACAAGAALPMRRLRRRSGRSPCRVSGPNCWAATG